MHPTNKQLIIFIKTPHPGKCKTRLIPFLSANQACEFYKSLVMKCLENIKSLAGIDIALYITPEIQHPFIQNLKNSYPVSLHKQQGNDLGERMHHAINTSLLSYKKCVLIGTDCPVLDAPYIEQAFNALDHHDMAIGPAQDGGYVLIAATRTEASLFSNVNWGTEKVLQQSLKNIKAARFSLHTLSTLWDIDTPEDYLQYQSIINNSMQPGNNHG